MLKTSPSRHSFSNRRLASLRARIEKGARKSKTKHRRDSLTANLRKSCKTLDQRVCCKSDLLICYQRNQQYSIIALTDEAGNIKERYAYGAPTILDANGVELATSTENNRYMYTGRDRNQDR